MQYFYYKMRQLLQNEKILLKIMTLSNATCITKCVCTQYTLTLHVFVFKIFHIVLYIKLYVLDIASVCLYGHQQDVQTTTNSLT